MVTQGPGAVRVVDHGEALALIAGGIAVLDVRTPEEYASLGHLAGARLLPVDLIASAPAILPQGAPVLVYCEHGVRSAHAARVLARAGLAPVYDLARGMAAWRGAREFGAGAISGPAPWVLENTDLLRRGMRVLDLACGRGRHALLFAAAGFTVTALDRDVAAIEWLSATAARLGWPVDAQARDLETADPGLGVASADLIVVTRYLHRPLMPAIIDALAPGGVLLYETFTAAQAARGTPTSPQHLLQPGELVRLVAPLDVVRSREGDVDGQAVASVAAIRR